MWGRSPHSLVLRAPACPRNPEATSQPLLPSLAALPTRGRGPEGEGSRIRLLSQAYWIPAFAGMTVGEGAGMTGGERGPE